MRKVIGFLIIALIMIGWFLLVELRSDKDGDSYAEASSVALGKAVATAIHQTLTDPYFMPLEKLANFLARHPSQEGISVDMLTKWAPDDELPTCFVWQTNGRMLQIDHPTSPFVLEELVKVLREALNKANPGGQLYISTFKAEEERWWVGFLPIPVGVSIPNQMAGVFFSFKEYLNRDVPRLLNDFVNRPRFPLVPFEGDSVGRLNTRTGNISFRIVDSNGEVFYQYGKTFTPDKMIYSESKYNVGPVIVALQKNWDLEVYDSNYEANVESKQNYVKWLFLVGSLLVIGVVLWWIIRK